MTRTPYQRRLAAENSMDTIGDYAHLMTDAEVDALARIATALDARVPDVEED